MVKFNLIYDKSAIKAAVKYLDKHNPKANITEIHIKGTILTTCKENLTPNKTWVSYVATGGYICVFSLEGYTKKNVPIIAVEVYVTPNIGNYNHKEQKLRG